MAASDLAFVQSFRTAEDRRRREEDRQSGIKRRGAIEEREDTRFGRESKVFEQTQTLFRQQQEFQKTAKEREDWRRKANKAMAIFRGTSGQVYQPLLDLYAQIPDGGKMHSFKRNDDGTFSFDFEWQGNRHRTDKATFDEVATMGMSFMEPQSYLQASGAAAAATLDHQRRLERIAVQNLGKGAAKGETDFERRKQFFSEYESLMLNTPDQLTVTDQETGDERQMTFPEYLDLQKMALGEDGETGKLIDVNFETITLAEMIEVMRKQFNIDGEKAVNAAVTSILGAAPQRAGELAKLMGSLPKASQALVRQTAGIKDEVAESDDIATAAANLGAGGGKGAIDTGEQAAGQQTNVLDPSRRVVGSETKAVEEFISGIPEDFRTRKARTDLNRKALQLEIDMRSGTANEDQIRAIAELSVEELVKGTSLNQTKAESILRQARTALSQ